MSPRWLVQLTVPLLLCVLCSCLPDGGDGMSFIDLLQQLLEATQHQHGSDPNDAEPAADCDGDGISDEESIADGTVADCNGNGVPDLCDLSAATSVDANANGVPDECEGDCNDNGVPDDLDLSAGTSADCDTNGIPDECELDNDGDGVIDACDDCPADPAKTAPGACGCGVSDVDSDADGTPDCQEVPETQPVDCNGNGTPDSLDVGSGASADCDTNGVPDECQADGDADGVIDPCDGCPDDPDKQASGACGCSVTDADSDGDGEPDCRDDCPDDPMKTAAGACGCGVPDADANGNGTADCLDPPVPSVTECTVTYFAHDGDAARDFERCFTAEGRIGDAAAGHPHTYELAVSTNANQPENEHDFDWQCNTAYDFTLTWDGQAAVFQVGDVVIAQDFACGTLLNALQVRCRAVQGRVQVYDLEINAQPLTQEVSASWREPHDPLNILQLACNFDDAFVLAGKARFFWSGPPLPRNSQLGFQVTAGRVDQEHPPTDCNANGVPDDQDIAAGTSTDCDASGVPDECQPDGDGDGAIDACDGCPDDPNKVEPGWCGCGVSDADSDGDGTPDCDDGCPDDPEKVEPGLCGCGIADTDSDGDGTPDCSDGCPDDPEKVVPGLCGCGAADTDSDSDGTADCNDECPEDPNKVAPGVCGCGVADTDGDGDGTPDCNDGCPDDPDKVAPGLCGCGLADTDSDGDGTPNCNDQCPDDPNKIEPGGCGCGMPDTDSDGDSTPDCNDGCPGDPAKVEPGVCGCGAPETDTDGDGTPDCADQCVDDPGKVEPGVCGCGMPDTDGDGDGLPDCVDACLDSTPGAVVDEYGCEDVVADAGPDVTRTEVGLVTLHGSATGGTGGYGYVWTAPGWAGSTEQEPVVMPTQTTTYTLTVTDDSPLARVGVDTVTITIEPQLRQYTIINLDAGRSDTSYPYGINDAGVVVGYYYTPTLEQRAFLYDGGTRVDLGSLGGNVAVAHGVNNLGQVVGESMNASGDLRAFVWESSTGMRDLGTLGGPSSAGYAINESGEVVGYSDFAASYHAFVYWGGVMSQLGTLGYAYSGAFDINESSQIVGVLVDHMGDATAFLYENGTLYDLGAPLLSQSQAWVINDEGLVAGSAWGPGEDQSFLCAGGLVVNLGALAGLPKTYAVGINNAGQVVGTSRDATNTVSHAFIYTGGQLHDLNTLLVPGHGWDHLAEAYDINEQGQIVGYGVLNGQYRGFILTPVP